MDPKYSSAERRMEAVALQLLRCMEKSSTFLLSEEAATAASSLDPWEEMIRQWKAELTAASFTVSESNQMLKRAMELHQKNEAVARSRHSVSEQQHPPSSSSFQSQSLSLSIY